MKSTMSVPIRVLSSKRGPFVHARTRWPGSPRPNRGTATRQASGGTRPTTSAQHARTARWPSRPGASPDALDLSRTSRLRVQSIGDQAGVRLDLAGTVTGAGPEKATQAVPLGARHDVQVEMGD